MVPFRKMACRFDTVIKETQAAFDAIVLDNFQVFISG
jgi:hypothetical protein